MTTIFKLYRQYDGMREPKRLFIALGCVLVLFILPINYGPSWMKVASVLLGCFLIYTRHLYLRESRRR